MTDIFDRAQELELLQRAEAIAKFSEKIETGDGLSHCSDCCEQIPEARRNAVRGCTRCVQCQTDAEKALRR